TLFRSPGIATTLNISMLGLMLYREPRATQSGLATEPGATQAINYSWSLWAETGNSLSVLFSGFADQRPWHFPLFQACSSRLLLPLNRSNSAGFNCLDVPLSGMLIPPSASTNISRPDDVNTATLTRVSSKGP